MNGLGVFCFMELHQNTPIPNCQMGFIETWVLKSSNSVYISPATASETLIIWSPTRSKEENILL